MRRKDVVLEIDIVLSRVLDSLCLEMAITHSDSNSLGLLEILQWRLEGSISQQQFSQLYTAWVESKSISDVLLTHQSEMYDKAVLLDNLQGSLRSVNKIRQSLQLLHTEYIRQLISQHLEDGIKAELVIVDQIVNQLDQNQFGHIRREQLLKFLDSMIQSGLIKVSDTSVDGIVDKLETLENQFSGVSCIISTRNFKNGLLNRQYGQAKLRKLYQSLLTVGKRHLKSIFEMSIQKWKSFPRFQKKSIDRYRRIFQEYDYLFMTGNPNAYEIEAVLEGKFGKQFMVMNDIDFLVIRQFCQVFKVELEKRCKEMGGLKLNKTESQKFEYPTPKSKSHTKNSQSLSKRSSLKSPTLMNAVTPKKLSSTINVTPKKPAIDLRQRQPRSNRETVMSSTSKKQVDVKQRMPKSPVQQNITYRDANSSTEEILDKLTFFKNRRVESFEVVMKRLRMKR